tara:strand:- start:679 stop:894 length:216 start_codon:yes stop_codon:yes gene_type:complete
MTRTGGLQNDTHNISLGKVKQQLPDAKKHQQISFIKSGIRIIGYACIPFSIFWATTFLILSEVVGIIEEMV